MIAYLQGTILEKGKDFVILLVGDIGYKIGLAERSVLAMEKGTAVQLYTHQVIRDDAHELYGFSNIRELEFFWKLTGVSGVGPKMAMHFLSLGVLDSLTKAIDKGDIDYLASAQGVGKKTAQRVVLELKGKLVDGESVPTGAGEVISALENLGFSRSQARDTAMSLPAEATTEEKIKLALRQLSK